MPNLLKSEEISRTSDKLPATLRPYFKGSDSAFHLKRLYTMTGAVLGNFSTKRDALASVESFAELADLVCGEEKALGVVSRAPVDEVSWAYDSLEVSKGCNNSLARDVVRCKDCNKLLFPNAFASHYGTAK